MGTGSGTEAEPDPTEAGPNPFALFRARSPLAHLLALLSVGAVFAASFAAVGLAVAGSEAAFLADGRSGLFARQVAAFAAALASGAVAGLLFVRGLGGPAVNVVLPGLCLLTLPVVVLAGLGTVPEAVLVGAEPARFPGALRPSIGPFAVAGPLATMAVVGAAAWLADDDDRHAWERRHMPHGWRRERATEREN